MSEIKAINRISSLFPDVAEFYETYDKECSIDNRKPKSYIKLEVWHSVTSYTMCLLNLNLITKDEYDEIIAYFLSKLNTF